MNIPDKYKDLFKQAIANTFYDKDIEVWTAGEVQDDEGCSIGAGKKDFIESMKCNFQFKTLEYIQQQYGKEIIAEAVITCDKTKAEIGNIVVYENIDYEITAMPVSDTHTTMLVKKV